MLDDPFYEPEENSRKPNAVGLVIAIVVGLIFGLLYYHMARADEPTFSLAVENGRVTLTAEPCTKHEWLKGWQLARWSWKGKAYEACWRMQKSDGGQLVVVLDAAGEVTTFYPAQFTVDTQI